jgi:hypothetical protein
MQWRNAMVAGNAVIDPSLDDQTEAWAAFDRSEAGNAGIVDHVSFAIMRRLEITKAFTNDEHFRAAGFEIAYKGRNTLADRRFRDTIECVDRSRVARFCNRG